MKRALAMSFALILAACSKNPATVERDAAKAMSSGDFGSAESGFRWLSSHAPNDTRFKANLAFALTEEGKNDEALPIYAKLLDEGEGTYDLFAYYAKSLDAAGRVDEAITWDYRALATVPQLVDVRGNLAKLLTRAGRPYEALSLLSSFDNQLESRGHGAYFEAQRIAIATKLPAASATASAAIQATKIEGNYYTVVMGRSNEAFPFLIDTGATHTTMSREVMTALGIEAPHDARQVTMETADRRPVSGRRFSVPRLQVGPVILTDVDVVECEDCVSLLGQTTLERFDLATRKTSGLEILTLKHR